MKLWLDDKREPSSDWVWVKTATEAIRFLTEFPEIAEISLDHDLGLEHETGYTVALWIEEQAFNGLLRPLKWKLHSANPVGVAKMRMALENADKFWKK